MRKIISTSTILSPVYIAVWIGLAVTFLALGGWSVFDTWNSYQAQTNTIDELRRVTAQSSLTGDDFAKTLESARDARRNMLVRDGVFVFAGFIAFAFCARMANRLVRLRREVYRSLANPIETLAAIGPLTSEASGTPRSPR